MSGHKHLPLIYLGGPIDNVVDPSLLDWRQSFYPAPVVPSAVYDPERAFAVWAGWPPHAVVSINRAALLASNAMLVGAVPAVTWGTPTEMAWAEQAGIPVIVWNPVGIDSPYLRRFPCFEDAKIAYAEAVSRAREHLKGGPRPAHILATVPAILAPALSGDAGHDLAVCVGCTVPRGGFRQLGMGTGDIPLCIAMPDGLWAMPMARSGWASRGLIVLPTLIDSGYRGPIYAWVYNAGGEALRIRKGDRVVQLVFHQARTMAIDLLPPGKELPASARGESGFGSTGA